LPHTFASLLMQVVFSTKNREPYLSAELPGRLFPYMGGIVRELKGTALIVNGPADHVHLLLSMPVTVSVADLLRVPLTYAPWRGCLDSSTPTHGLRRGLLSVALRAGCEAPGAQNV